MSIIITADPGSNAREMLQFTGVLVSPFFLRAQMTNKRPLPIPGAGILALRDAMLDLSRIYTEQSKRIAIGNAYELISTRLSQCAQSSFGRDFVFLENQSMVMKVISTTESSLEYTNLSSKTTRSWKIELLDWLFSTIHGLEANAYVPTDDDLDNQLRIQGKSVPFRSFGRILRDTMNPDLGQVFSGLPNGLFDNFSQLQNLLDEVTRSTGQAEVFNNLTSTKLAVAVCRAARESIANEP